MSKLHVIRLLSVLLLTAGYAWQLQAQPVSNAPAASGLAGNADDWVSWGTAVHGGFGSHIALGIRLGLDAMQRLGVQRRELEVTVTEGAGAPCACLADGISVATSASAGQRSLTVLPKSASAEFLALVDVQVRGRAGALRYKVLPQALAPLADINREPKPQVRLSRVMALAADQLFVVEPKEYRP